MLAFLPFPAKVRFLLDTLVLSSRKAYSLPLTLPVSISFNLYTILPPNYTPTEPYRRLKRPNAARACSLARHEAGLFVPSSEPNIVLSFPEKYRGCRGMLKKKKDKRKDSILYRYRWKPVSKHFPLEGVPLLLGYYDKYYVGVYERLAADDTPLFRLDSGKLTRYITHWMLIHPTPEIKQKAKLPRLAEGEFYGIDIDDEERFSWFYVNQALPKPGAKVIVKLREDGKPYVARYIYSTLKSPLFLLKEKVFKHVKRWAYITEEQSKKCGLHKEIDRETAVELGIIDDEQDYEHRDRGRAARRY